MSKPSGRGQRGEGERRKARRRWCNDAGRVTVTIPGSTKALLAIPAASNVEPAGVLSPRDDQTRVGP